MSSAVPSTTDFAPPVRECPVCGAVCKRHSAYTRKVRDVSLDGPVVLEVRVGNYKCKACDRFFKPDVPFAAKGKRYTDRAVRKATVAVQQDKTTYTGLPHRMERDYAVRPAKSTGWAWFQSFAGDIDITEYLRWACGRFSGQLSVDSVQDKDAHLWFATDPLNRDLILGYLRCESPNGESLTAFLTTLRDDYGIRPTLFTCDGAAVFDKVPGQVWPETRLQLCHFHVLRHLFIKYLRHSLVERFRRCRPVKPVRPNGPQGQRRNKDFHRAYRLAVVEYREALAAYTAEAETWAEAYRKRRLFLRRLDRLEPTDADREAADFIRATGDRYPELATFRTFVTDLYAVMGCRDAGAAEAARSVFLARWEAGAQGEKHFAAVVARFRDDRFFAKLFPFADYDNAHRTTNSTERANRWFRKRQKTHYRNRKERTIKNMLHADLIYRRERSPLTRPGALKPKAVPPAMAA